MSNRMTHATRIVPIVRRGQFDVTPPPTFKAVCDTTDCAWKSNEVADESTAHGHAHGHRKDTR